MKIAFEKVQEAFVDGRITLEQLIEILVDNFGPRKTRQILRKNLELALEQEATLETSNLSLEACETCLSQLP
jgi:hypothetical protein